MSALQSPIDLTVVDDWVKPIAGVTVVVADVAGAVQELASTMQGTLGLNDSNWQSSKLEIFKKQQWNSVL